MSKDGWITRIKKGLYAINDPLTRAPKAHPFAIGAAIVNPSAISHWSALQHWGLTEQISSAITLSSPTRTFPPRRETQDADLRPAWVVGGVRYQFTTIPPAHFFGISNRWIDERNQAPMFDAERALLDAFQHFHIVGSLSVALEILETHMADLDIKRLVRYALQLKVGAVIKRIGWALEALNAPADLVAPLQAHPAKGDSPLDPGRPSLGRHNRAWHVIENLSSRPIAVHALPIFKSLQGRGTISPEQGEGTC
ncbi:MAG: hypothetical protein Q8R28_18965 [Dehalococcoidia bacterium]|nr:hypothetical protein [Dehalococcoidia bacterium]